MTDLNSRRNFLRGRFSKRQGPLRPPWSLAEDDFLQACTRCGDCVKTCPTQIIGEGDGGYPVIDFADGECTFCADCVTVCKSGALKRRQDQLPWHIRARIGEDCLARQGIECRVCGEQCAAGAISFPLQPGVISVPEVDTARCTGCGACVEPCPTRTITVA